jgi:hypothetical protein
MIKTKKGQVGGLQAGFYALMFMAVALTVTIIIMAFGADYTDDQRQDFCTGTNITWDDEACWACADTAFPTYNASSDNCVNSTGGTGAREPYGNNAYNITVGGLTSYETLSDGTEDVTDVGIITIVLGLLVALIGIFGWYGYSKRQ